MYILLSTYWICISFSFQLGSEGWFHSPLLIPSRPFAFYSVHYYLYALCSLSNLNIPLMIAPKWWIIYRPSKTNTTSPALILWFFSVYLWAFLCSGFSAFCWARSRWCIEQWRRFTAWQVTVPPVVFQQKDIFHPRLWCVVFPCPVRVLGLQEQLTTWQLNHRYLVSSENHTRVLSLTCEPGQPTLHSQILSLPKYTLLPDISKCHRFN